MDQLASLIREAEDAADCAETAIRIAWLRGAIKPDGTSDNWVVSNDALKHMLACAMLSWQYKHEVI